MSAKAPDFKAVGALAAQIAKRYIDADQAADAAQIVWEFYLENPTEWVHFQNVFLGQALKRGLGLAAVYNELILDWRDDDGSPVSAAEILSVEEATPESLLSASEEPEEPEPEPFDKALFQAERAQMTWREENLFYLMKVKGYTQEEAAYVLRTQGSNLCGEKKRFRERAVPEKLPETRLFALWLRLPLKR